MLLTSFLEQIQNKTNTINFDATIATIDQNYTFQETSFTNGNTHNKSGQNNGSCKIFAFGLLNLLTKEQTLHCFGNYYRKDVLDNPAGSDHQNIRNFMLLGWEGISFEGEALSLKL